jgi:hypothetical protein
MRRRTGNFLQANTDFSFISFSADFRVLKDFRIFDVVGAGGASVSKAFLSLRADCFDTSCAEAMNTRAI